MSEKFRIESDLLGELQVPADAYYGVQTQRALNNYKISTTRMCHYPDYVIAMACIKYGAAKTNKELGALDPTIADAIMIACKEIIDGQLESVREFAMEAEQSDDITIMALKRKA